MEPAQPPYLACSRRALALMPVLLAERRTFGFERAATLTGLPRTTLTRLLGELVQHGLLARLRRDVYASPLLPTFALLLVEPDAYARSLLLHADVLARVGEGPWAFACLPVRRALPVEIPTVVPVLRLREADREHGMRSPLFLYHDFDPAEITTAARRFPTDVPEDEGAIERAFPVLSPKTSLALLAATGDPRMLEAVGRAAPKLGVSPAKLADAARRLHPARASAATFPNTILLPRWLEDMAQSARDLQARKAIGSRLADGGGGRAG